MRACVIFDTRYGNTEKIARSFETGLKEAGIQTFCVNAKDVAVDSLKQYDLICVGAPTEAFTASKPMKEFLGRLKSIDLSGKYGFAFDTKLDWRFSGSAAKLIEKELNSLDLQMIAPRESAIVFTLKERGAITGARLKEGEEKRFEQIGLQLGTVKPQSGTHTINEGDRDAKKAIQPLIRRDPLPPLHESPDNVVNVPRNIIGRGSLILKPKNVKEAVETTRNDEG